jgi:hypothetical protein
MSNAVHHPEHYITKNVWVEVNGERVQATVECADVIDALNLPRWVAFSFKYLWRAGQKGNAYEDIAKAAECCRRHLMLGEDSNANGNR